jgi:hypothetical protein
MARSSLLTTSRTSNHAEYRRGNGHLWVTDCGSYRLLTPTAITWSSRAQLRRQKKANWKNSLSAPPLARTPITLNGRRCGATMILPGETEARTADATMLRDDPEGSSSRCSAAREVPLPRCTLAGGSHRTIGSHALKIPALQVRNLHVPSPFQAESRQGSIVVRRKAFGAV